MHKKKTNNNEALALAVTRKSVGKSLKKGSNEEINERRRIAMRMRMRGLGYRQIAKELGVGHMTIKRDLDTLREETASRLDKFEKNYALSESLSVFEEVETQAWRQYNNCLDGSKNQVGFLNTVRAARNDQIKLLTDVGFISKAPSEIKHTVRSEVIEHWTPEAQDLVAMAIIKASLKQPEAPIRDAIDVESSYATLPEHVEEVEEEEVEVPKARPVSIMASGINYADLMGPEEG